jgi:hypothetical protein
MNPPTQRAEKASSGDAHGFIIVYDRGKWGFSHVVQLSDVIGRVRPEVPQRTEYVPDEHINIIHTFVAANSVNEEHSHQRGEVRRDERSPAKLVLSDFAG